MIFGDIFNAEKENEERKKKKQNEKIIKDNIIRDIRILFEQEKEDYHLMNILIKLNLT